MNTHQKIPATIVTGFLGSGKTTLLRHLLTHAQGGNTRRIVATMPRQFDEHIEDVLDDADAAEFAELRSGLAGLRHRVRDVMEFHVEKHIKALPGQFFDQLRAGADKQFLADFQTAQRRIDAGGKFKRRRSGRVVKRDNHARIGFHRGSP